MNNLDLEAIKSRALEVIADIDHEVAPKAIMAQLSYDVVELLDEVVHLRARQAITDDMVERAALAMARIDEWPNNEDLGGNPFTGTRDEEFRDEYMVMARDALEAALGEDDA